ncbi:MAG: hypothetical protein HY827_00940 [Actinobacteria bacterium]|nr:hypothetical protein [Actinomycetota bacterium]
MPPTSPSSRRAAKALIARISGAYGLVLLLTIVTFVTMSSIPDGMVWKATGLSVGILTAVVGILGSGVSHRSSLLTAGTGAAAIILAFLAAAIDSNVTLLLAAAITACLLLVCEAAILRQVVRSTSVDFRTILGAITSYTMLGLIFSFVYLAAVLAQGSGDFFIGHASIERGDLIFFSYTTLTTTGYGNLVPAAQPGMSIAVVEMLFGQIFLVTLVARLVSLWQPRKRQMRDSSA